MNIMKKVAVFAVTVMCIASALCGCTTTKNATEDEEAKAKAEAEQRSSELKQNDYRGGVIRTKQLKDAVLDTMDTMKSNNSTLRETNPNSFWTTDGYQDFVVNFLSAPIIDDTKWFNEEETSWEDIVTQMGKVESSFTHMVDGSYSMSSEIEIKRNEKDDYSILNVPVEGIMFTNQENSGSSFKGVETYRILYDCDKDWCKAYSLLDLNTEFVPEIVPEIYEYARLDDNTFLIQTSRERLMVILEPAEEDTAFEQRTVKEFYYSKLLQDGMRTTFEPYHALAEYDEETGEYLKEASMKNAAIQGYKVINGEGEIATQYGLSNSLFIADDVYSLGTNWVFEDKSLQQTICYKDQCLVVITYNKLTEKYERFTYRGESVTKEDMEALAKLVDFDGLVGEQDIPDIEIPQPDVDAIMKNKEQDGNTDDNPENNTDAEEAANSALTEMHEQAKERQDGDVEYVDSVS